jgi:hypothetical protein
MEYLAIKGNDRLIFAATWMNFKNMLSERSQSPRKCLTICMKSPEYANLYRQQVD